MSAVLAATVQQIDVSARREKHLCDTLREYKRAEGFRENTIWLLQQMANILRRNGY